MKQVYELELELTVIAGVFAEPDTEYEVELELPDALYGQKFWTEKQRTVLSLAIPYAVTAQSLGPHALRVMWQSTLTSPDVEYTVEYTPVYRVLTTLVDKAPAKSILV